MAGEGQGHGPGATAFLHILEHTHNSTILISVMSVTLTAKADLWA